MFTTSADASVEQRLGVSHVLSSMGITVVTIGGGLLAPIVGALAARYSLRLLFTTGAILSTLGYALPAATRSYAPFLAV